MIRCFVLMGGLVGLDGTVFSRGMAALSNRLNQLKDTKSTYHYWSSYRSVERAINALPEGTKTAVIGFSGGGSRLTFISAKADLAVGYDPSPAGEIRGVRNYQRVLCYYNVAPNYLALIRLGGGLYVGVNVEVTRIQNDHWKVQYMEELHVKTMNAVRGLTVT